MSAPDSKTEELADEGASGSEHTAPASLGEPAATAVAKSDERLAYQSFGRRLLSRPEFVGLLGALIIYSFFWTVSPTFGQAAGIQTVLEVAAMPLGIMAIAVAILMIGGEFDLSAGAMYGAMAMLVVYFVRDAVGPAGGLSLSYWIAIPLSLAVALLIGWLNGTLLERTGMPSFIVTLATFFVLRGLKLAYAKILVNQIQVGSADDGQHYEFWNTVFNSEWQRLNHPWESRDAVYTVLALVGVLLVLLALFEFTFERRQTLQASGLPVFAVGLVGLVGGVAIMHLTDGNEILPAAVLTVAALVTAVGLARWRYEPHAAIAGDESADISGVARFVAGSVVLYVLAILVGRAISPYSDETVWHLVNEEGVRGIGIVAFGLGSAWMMLRAVNSASTPRLQGALMLFTSLMLVGFAFFVQSESGTRQFRVEMFTILLGFALFLACWGVVTAGFQLRSAVDRGADRTATIVGIVGLVLLFAGVATRLLFVIDAEIAREDAGRLAKYNIRFVWFLGFTVVMSWVMRKTQFGSWVYAVGGNKEAARQIGVPAARVKKQLFMLVAGSAWLAGVLTAFRINSVQAGTGNGQEFNFIIAAVVGGTLLNGGFGSALGAAMGAMIMAMGMQGISFSGWNTDWRFVFLGAILLAAVYANQKVRSLAEAR